MDVAVVTGSAGLVGAESVRFFSAQGFQVVGIDNDMRRVFFGPEASTAWASDALRSSIATYRHYHEDVRNYDRLDRIFADYGSSIKLVIHTAAQPSHDWAAREPRIDFGVNAMGTLNLLELTRKHCHDAVFIFTSSNKVYGDRPNQLPLVEADTRWTIEEGHEYEQGITESMPIDHCTHSVFGASKVAADVMVQEYGRYFGLKTVCFRCGCITGSGQSGAELHGFLAYLMRCCVCRREYQIFGHKGKQVRDNIHSHDLVQAFHAFFKHPGVAEVYNIGGGIYSNVSMMEAIALCEAIAAKKMDTVYRDQHRVGDHMWWIGGLARFESHYPEWRITYSSRRILEEVYKANVERGP